MKERKKFIEQNNETLKNSKILRKNKNYIDRISYFRDNMSFNQAYIFNKNLGLEYFVRKFEDYRKKWKKQPLDSLKNKYLSKELNEKKFYPLSIDIEISAFCDLACPFCFREAIVTPDKIIDSKFCFDLIDQAADMGVPSIKFNWRGEPLLHPKISEFIKYSKKKGILDTIINTNATNLTETKAKQLITAGLDYIIFSFDGGTKKTYEKMRPGRFKKNNFEDVYKNIKNFKKIRDNLGSKFPYTKIQMIITSDTINEVNEFFERFDPIVDDVSVTNYTERTSDTDKLSSEEQKTYTNKIKKFNLTKNPSYSRTIDGEIKVASKRLPCDQPYQRLMVTYEGKVGMCCMDWGAKHPVGFASKKAFRNSNDYNQVIKRIEENKKGFELLKQAKMPRNYNSEIKKEVSKLKDIWFGKEIDHVREKQFENKAEEVDICKNCNYPNIYEWK